MSSILGNREWVRTIKCGCGDCNLKLHPSGKCPLESAPGAKWLWSSRPKQRDSSATPEVEVDEPGYGSEDEGDDRVSV
jgi:hypothetical protein